MAAAPEATALQQRQSSKSSSKKSKRNRGENAAFPPPAVAAASSANNNSCAAGGAMSPDQQVAPPTTTRHLEFNQAMQDFKTMFPKMDLATIETILRANEGAVDATIDQLLTLTAETPDNVTPSPSMDAMPMLHHHQQDTPTGHSPPPMYSHSSSGLIGGEEPPPYSPPSPTSPFSQVNRPTPQRNNDSVFQEFMSTLQPTMNLTSNSSNSHPVHPPSRNSHQVPPPPLRQSISLPAGGTHTRWNPPLLGRLPDDFLRIASSMSHTPSIVSSHLRHRLQRNVEQRSSVDKYDVEMQQMLNDERVALYMQNEEFLRELQHNPEFSEALENDVTEATRNASLRNSRLSQSHHPHQPSSHQQQQQQQHQQQQQLNLHRNNLNHGATSQTEGAVGGAGAMAHAGPDDVVFRDKLKHMGKSTKVKFSQMARKFNSKKKKKSSRSGLEGAPYMQSTANLLESEEDDDSLLHRHKPQVEENIYAESNLI